MVVGFQDTQGTKEEVVTNQNLQMVVEIEEAQGFEEKVFWSKPECIVYLNLRKEHGVQVAWEKFQEWKKKTFYNHL